MINQDLNGKWEFHQLNEKTWLPATVPGGVHTDLLALGKIPDPFVADNEKQVQWIGETDWVYRKTFAADSTLMTQDKKYLVCDGLDTLAEVSLNGRLLGKTDNMFRRWQWDVNDILKEGENKIEIVFRAPVSFITARQAENPLKGGGDIPGGPHLRKAPCHWGWDWGPKLPPIGIWKDIRLEGYSAAKLADVHIRQIHADSKVTVSATAKVEHWKKADLHLDLKITAPDGKTQTQESVSVRMEDDHATQVQSVIKNPQHWWPNGYGSQPLYTVEVTLRLGKTTLDQRKYQVGLRTLELRQQPDKWGESFTFVVNGVPVFAKGADWIPTDSFPTRITDAHLENLLQSAVDANMNMLRVWGGGFYPEDRFYEMCDRLGIMLWQDFMFACGIYPADDVFAENVRVEAIENVRRLRHHACLALWCGNNEMEQGWVDWGWNQPNDVNNQRLKAGYDRMFHHLLPGIVAVEDPDHSYWPSSASSGIAFADPNGQVRGDVHYWDVWHGRKPFAAYRQQFPRFQSEFGFQSLPPFKTIQTYAAPEDQNMTSYVMEHHQRNASGNTLIMSQMGDNYRMPKDFPSLVYASMVLQAEGIRYGVEHWRRNMERVSGTLYWQLNDCWPVASWASVDYYGRWKALHYAAKRFYAPVLLSVENNGKRMSIHVTSDLTAAWDGTIRWSLQSLDGKTLKKGKETVHAAPLADTAVRTLDFTEEIADADSRTTIFVCELWQEKERISGSVSTFVPDKHLALVKPDVHVDVNLSGQTLTFNLSANTLARFVELSLDDVDVLFSDNYFDLPVGLTYQVTAPLPSGWTLKQVKQALHVRSLYDSYA